MGSQLATGASRPPRGIEDEDRWGLGGAAALRLDHRIVCGCATAILDPGIGVGYATARLGAAVRPMVGAVVNKTPRSPPTEGRQGRDGGSRLGQVRNRGSSPCVGFAISRYSPTWDCSELVAGTARHRSVGSTSFEYLYEQESLPAKGKGGLAGRHASWMVPQERSCSSGRRCPPHRAGLA